MVARRCALLVVAVLTAAACIPGRDNPNDPAIAPVARLAIVDVTLPDGSCGLVTSSSATAGAVTSRGRCLRLDGSGSSDPQGIDDIERYRFYVTATHALGVLGQVEHGQADTPLQDGPLPVYVLTTANLTSYPFGPLTDVTFALEIEDARGHRSHATATVALTNAAPVALPDTLRIFPIGGLPWVAANLPFYGTRSFDPDGDALEYYWRFEGEQTFQKYVEEELPVLRPPPVGADRIVGELYVSDGDLFSTRTRTEIAFRNPPVWAKTVLGFAALDPYRRSRPSFGEVLFLDRNPPLTATASGIGLELRSWPGGELVAEAPANGVPAAYDPVADQLWTRDFQQVERWDVEGLVPAGTTFLQTALIEDMNGVGADGTFWSVYFGRVSNNGISPPPHIEYVTAAMVATTCSTPANVALGGAALRPTALGELGSELWVLETIQENGLALPGRLLRYTGGSPVPEVLLESDAIRGAMVFEWTGPDEFWVVDQHLGLVRMDATLVEQGLWEEAVRLSVPVQGGEWIESGAWEVDPQTGDLWLVAGDVITLRVTLDGRMDVYDGYIPQLGMAVDRQGLLFWEWDADPSEIGFLLEPRQGHTTTNKADRDITVPFDPPGDVVRVPTDGDPMTGGLWVLTRRPSLVNVGPDGTILREITSMTLGDEEVPLQQGSELRVAADGSFAWFIRSFGPNYTFGHELYRLDLSTPVPAAVEVADFGGILSPLAQWDVANPSGASLLVVRTPGLVESLDASGSYSTVLDLTPQSASWISVIRDGAWCVFTETPEGMELRRETRWVENGVETLFDSSLVPAGGDGATGAVAVRGPTGDPACWVSTAFPGFGTPALRAYDAAGLRHSGFSSGAKGWLATGPDDLWQIDNLSRPVHLFLATSGSAVEATEVFDVGAINLVR